ncbi:MAG: PAS domain-containing protein [Candidatus Rokubacteria bacterium]|nr:PAS domain-containing protein [Candidatus Rokubacteria bacterium]
MSRFKGYLIVSAGLVVVVVVAAGLLVGAFFERYVLSQEEAQTAEIVQSQAHQHLTALNFENASDPSAHEGFATFLEGLPGVFRIKAYDRTGRIIWSNEPRLIGLAFPDNAYLLAALRGRVTTVLEEPKRSEHVFEKNPRYVAEAYVPITFPGTSQAAGVIETYKDMTAVMLDLQRTSRLIWGVAGAMGLFLYGALGLVVWRASASEERAIQRLERQNEELTLLQQFTESVLRPLDLAQVAAHVVESAASGLRLADASLYRAEAGGGLTRLASWPPGAEVLPPPGALVAEALAGRAHQAEEGLVVIPVFPQRGPAHLFAGHLLPGSVAPAPAALQTLEIMLHEAAIALANVELFRDIREAHERLAAILAGIADRLVIVDRELHVVWMNAAATAHAGAGAVGRTCFELTGSPREACDGCPAVRTLYTGQVERGVLAQPGPGGRTTYADVVAAPLRDASGQVYQILEVSRDITEMVEMEARLKDSNQALLDAQAQLVEKERLAAIGQVVVGLHHAILNPLTGILGAIQVLKQEDLGLPERARTVAAAEEEIRKIEALVRRLPDLRRVAESPYIGSTTMVDLERSFGEGDSPAPGKAG